MGTATQHYENTPASGPQIERINGCLGGGLRFQSASILFSIFFLVVVSHVL